MKVITLNECLHYMESIGYRLDARGLGVFIFRQENRELTLTLSELRAKFNKENSNERSV
jgi:hypothetical protein